MRSLAPQTAWHDLIADISVFMAHHLLVTYITPNQLANHLDALCARLLCEIRSLKPIDGP
jgi:hypothetical protein